MNREYFLIFYFCRIFPGVVRLVILSLNIKYFIRCLNNVLTSQFQYKLNDNMCDF